MEFIFYWGGKNKKYKYIKLWELSSECQEEIKKKVNRRYWELLVSHGCCNRSLQMQWLETLHIYYHAVLEVRSLRWVCRAVFFLAALGENPFPCLVQLLKAAHIPSHLTLCHFSLCCLSHLLWLWPSCLPSLRILVIELGPSTQCPHLKICNLIISATSATPLLWCQTHFIGSGD